MKINIINITKKGLLIGASVVAIGFTACNPEPNESDLYTFTGETIESLIAKDSTLTSFNYILGRVGYDKMMSAYGNYTCFAPGNEGVVAYCDSLYNDTEAALPHNGMTQPEGASSDYLSSPDSVKIKWLTDSLCLSIAKYHITSTYRDLVSMTGNGEVSTMLGYEFSFSSDTGNTILGNKATIVSSDNVATNGLLHVIDNVIPRFTRFIGDMLERNKDTYSIFNEAFQLTGLADSLLAYTKGEFVFKQLRRANHSAAISPANGAGTTGTADCKVGYTLFAESDQVLSNYGINSVDDLIAYANKVYADAPDWYDYMAENGLTVSTGTDYTNRFNALNMYMAYHILGASMSINQLVYEKGSNTYWNYAPDADPYDYYETMLPHTLMKIWAPHDISGGKALFINRYRMNNTLTDQLASQGSETMHTLVQQGITVIRSGSLAAYNGYIHPISAPLVYDRIVPKGVLNERMRVNCTSLFPELISNKYRYWYRYDGNIPNTHDTQRLGIPNHYFDNMVLYDENICLVYVVHNEMRCYQSDQMQFWGSYDLAFKLPSVPSGIYEIRVVYAPMDYGSFMQYYIGNSSSVTSMTALGLPFDATVKVDDPRIGMVDAKTEDDMGVATDIALHNRGYMRGPYSYCGHAESTGWTTENNGRFEFGQSMTIRYVLGRVQLNQGEENWLRIKSLNPDNVEAPVGLDFVELCPASVLDNQQYVEDWY